jgi:hypothetical protein
MVILTEISSLFQLSSVSTPLEFISIKNHNSVVNYAIKSLKILKSFILFIDPRVDLECFISVSEVGLRSAFIIRLRLNEKQSQKRFRRKCAFLNAWIKLKYISPKLIREMSSPPFPSTWRNSYLVYAIHRLIIRTNVHMPRSKTSHPSSYIIRLNLTINSKTFTIINRTSGEMRGSTAADRFRERFQFLRPHSPPFSPHPGNNPFAVLNFQINFVCAQINRRHAVKTWLLLRGLRAASDLRRGRDVNWGWDWIGYTRKFSSSRSHLCRRKIDTSFEFSERIIHFPGPRSNPKWYRRNCICNCCRFGWRRMPEAGHCSKRRTVVEMRDAS